MSDTNSTLTVTRIQYRDIGIYEKAILDLGKVTVISGKNGTGKTTMMDGILSVLDEPDRNIIKDGNEDGTIILDLSNGMVINRTLRREGVPDLTVRNADGSKRERAKQLIASISEAKAVNPIVFLTAKPKEQIDWLMKAVDLKLSDEAREKLLAMYGDKQLLSTDLIAYLDATREVVYNRRTLANGELTTLKGHIAELQGTLPPEFEHDAEKVDIASMTDARDRLSAEYAAALRDAKEILTSGTNAASESAAYGIREHDRDINSERDACKREAQRKIDEINAELQQALDGLMDDARKFADARNGKLKTTIAGLQSSYDAKKAELESKYTPELDTQRVAIANAQVSAEERARQEATFGNITKANTDLAGRQAKWQDLEDQVLWIDAQKIELMKALPLDLTIENGVIHRGGIPWKRLNTAQRVEISVKLAEARSGALKLICLDGAECLDSEHCNALIEYCQTSECQFVIFKVSDDAEPQVTTFPAVQLREAA